MGNATVAALILAAGCSSRMGGFKPLLPFGDRTVVETAVATFFEAGVGDVRVVIGWRAEDLIPVVQRSGATVVPNPDYRSGMYSSVRAGIGSLGPEVEAFFLLPGDNPLVKPGTVRELLRRYQEVGAPVVYPRCQGRRGHPPLVRGSRLPNPLPPEPPGGFRSVLARLENEAVDLEVADVGVLADLDTPEDYRRALQMVEVGDGPLAG